MTAYEGVSYVLPLRWAGDQGIEELAHYLDRIADAVDEVIVVEGSEPELFERHRRQLRRCRHMAPHPDLQFVMGKVNGVITGVREARFERVVIADDDVRYGPAELAGIAAMLDHCELVRPQNYFHPLPWHARLDTARSLLNRVASGDLHWVSGDFPGTLAVRRSFFLEIGAYDGDLMFENLELMRTVAAAGGRVHKALDLYIERRPPSTRHFLSQRVRQAFDDFALPLRMAVFLAAGPLLGLALLRRRFRALAGATLAVVGMAETGRRRAGGAAVFPASAPLLAPLWVLERAACAWMAVIRRLSGGVPYGDRRIARSASSMSQLRHRYRTPSAVPSEAEPSAPSSASKPMLL